MAEYEGPWFTTFHCDGELPWQTEYYEVPLQIGEGFLDASSNYRRFRVVDIWYSTDKHGAFDYGRHVFLKDVTETDDDRLYKMEPQYFTPKH